jgi:flagellar hook-associated protein 2
MAVTSTTGSLATPGVGSGLDITSIVNKLMTVESQPLTALTTKEASFQAKISAYGSLKGGLAALQSALTGLIDVRNMKSVKASIADSTLATVSVQSTANPGNYSMKVSQLAQAHKISSTGFASTTSAVGSGSLTFTLGTYAAGTFTANAEAAAKSVTIGTDQNTLAGIRDAVNAAGIGVTATIVNDGSASGNRLVFTSGATGAANSLKVTVADDDTTNGDALGLSQLAYDPAGTAGNGKNMAETVAAQNALLVIDGISVTKASNVVTDAIQGVSINLTKGDPALTTTLTVTSDTSGIAKSVQDFVKAYNDLTASIVTATKYDTVNKKAAILTGDSAPRIIQSQLRTIVTGSLAGSGLTFTTLSQAGVSFKADGTLNLDTAKLNAAIASDPAGVSRLFAAVGSASDSLVSTSVTGSKTVPGSYALNVSRLATQGAAIGSTAAALDIVAGVNDTLTVKIDGTDATVTLAAGTYATAAALAAEVQSKINGTSALSLAGAKVTVTQSSGVLTLTSALYGSSSTVAVSGNAATGLFGSAAIAAGVDVEGTVGGYAATGSGKTLTGLIGSEIEGLKVVVDGGATGARGDVIYTQGFGSKLSQALSNLLGTDGVVSTSTATANRQIKDLTDRREVLQQRLEKVQANYLKQFQALDQMISSMNATSSYLTQQLDSLATLRTQIANSK